VTSEKDNASSVTSEVMLDALPLYLIARRLPKYFLMRACVLVCWSQQVGGGTSTVTVKPGGDAPPCASTMIV
jgi:hypothetical protein